MIKYNNDFVSPPRLTTQPTAPAVVWPKHYTPARSLVCETPYEWLQPESKVALQELASLAGWMLLVATWTVVFLVIAAFLGGWALLWPVVIIAYYFGKREDEINAAETKRISEIDCPRARHEAELLVTLKQIRDSQWCYSGPSRANEKAKQII